MSLPNRVRVCRLYITLPMRILNCNKKHLMYNRTKNKLKNPVFRNRSLWSRNYFMEPELLYVLALAPWPKSVVMQQLKKWRLRSSWRTLYCTSCKSISCSFYIYFQASMTPQRFTMRVSSGDTWSMSASTSPGRWSPSSCISTGQFSGLLLHVSLLVSTVVSFFMYL